MKGDGSTMDSNSLESGDWVSAQELAELVQESYHTVDYWSAMELLAYRRRGRKRFYAKETCTMACRRIRALQEEGHSLITIRRLLETASVL